MRSKCLMAMLIAMIFTITSVDAMNNISESTGPYMINLSLPDNINVTANTATENDQSFYGDKYSNYNLDIRDLLDPAHIATISIRENEENDLINIGRSLLETMKRLGYTDVAPEYWEVDGNSGILVVGNSTHELPQIHGFVYLFDNQTPVIISSTFPWDNGTSMMLETLHIKKVE